MNKKLKIGLLATTAVTCILAACTGGGAFAPIKLGLKNHPMLVLNILVLYKTGLFLATASTLKIQSLHSEGDFAKKLNQSSKAYLKIGCILLPFAIASVSASFLLSKNNRKDSLETPVAIKQRTEVKTKLKSNNNLLQVENISSCK